MADVSDGAASDREGTPELSAEEIARRKFDRAVQEELDKRAVRRAADDRERPPRMPLALGVVWDDDLTTIPPPEMAVGELVPERAVGFLGGPSSGYKSFVAIAIADGLAYGRPVMRHDTFNVRRARKALYVAGEGSSGVALRLRAARRRGGKAPGRQLAEYPQAVNLTSDRDADELLAFCLEHGIEQLIIDTFRANTQGVKENDNSEVTVVLGRLLAWRDEHGIGSLLLDHTNKSATGLADLGGAGAKRANADYVLMIDLPNSSRAATEQRMLRVGKLKDREDGRTWPIRLSPVPEIVDAEGYPSAVVEIGEVDGRVQDDRDWADQLKWPLPGDVLTLEPKVDKQGKRRGREGIPPLAMYLRHHAPAVTGSPGIDRREAIKAILPNVRMSDTTLRNAWSALREVGRIQPAEGVKAATGRHVWVSQPDDPAPVE